MNKRTSGRHSRTRFGVCALLAGLLLAFSAHAGVDRPASVEASGESAIFDVKATAGGTLRVGTKAGRLGDRWRVSIAQANTAGAVSAVGNGSITAFSGFASLAVTANVRYLVLVTWDRPLPGTFPADVTVRFTGATNADNPPVVQLNGGALASIVSRPVSWAEPPVTGCPGEGAALRCQSLVTCELSPAGDTDTFKVTVPANSVLSINVAADTFTYWKIYDPEGNPVNPNGCFDLCDVALPTAGTYVIQIANSANREGAYTLSLLGVAAASTFRCGPKVFAGGSPTTGEFNLGGDTDSFRLDNVKADEIYSINITGDFYTYWKIYDPDGTPVNSNGCSDLCNVEMPKPGDYTIVVANSANRTGGYTFSVQQIK